MLSLKQQQEYYQAFMGTLPKRAHKTLTLLKSAWLDTALGPMLVIADDHQLYLLEFVERRGLEKEIEKLRDRLPAAIVPGKTKSYAEQAQVINKPTAYRAVANANGMNQLAIIVPCHRIIRSHGELGGYGGGSARKQWLLEHEKKHGK